MNCPFCAGQMQSGVLRYDGKAALRWIPGDTPKSAADRFWDALGGVGMLTAGHGTWGFGTGKIQADYCAACKKMIFETDIVK